jgi:hypothetical protein
VESRLIQVGPLLDGPRLARFAAGLQFDHIRRGWWITRNYGFSMARRGAVRRPAAVSAMARDGGRP